MKQAARFLFVSWAGGGNTNPAYNLGSRLKLRGHDVTMLGWPEMADGAKRAGLKFASYPSMPLCPPDVSLDDAWSDLVEPRLLGAQTTQDVIDAVAAYQPDVLVIDAMMPAAFAAAATLPIPTVAIVHVLYRPFVDVWGDTVMKTSARELFATVDEVLVLTPPGLEPNGPLPAKYSIRRRDLAAATRSATRRRYRAGRSVGSGESEHHVARPTRRVANDS